MSMPAGQGSGLVRDLPAAGELLLRLIDETVAALEGVRDRVNVRR
jgi:hypothetical protein